MILMLFHLFCMFDDYWRINCRSQDSAGKRTVKIQYFGRSIIPRKYTEVHILSEDPGSQKESRRGATGGPHHPQARASPRPRLGMVWPPWPTTPCASSRISSSRKPKTRRATKNIFGHRCEVENTRERKALRQREICRGNPFPEGGIVAIVIVIKLDFIVIIIIIISTTRTITTIISTPSRCSFLGVILYNS